MTPLMAWRGAKGDKHQEVNLLKKNKSFLRNKKYVVCPCMNINNETPKRKYIKEPLQGLRRHKLLNAEIRKQTPDLYEQERMGLNATAYAKFFCPMGRYTYYVTGYDGDDTLFGYCISGLDPEYDEWGSSSFDEFATCTLDRFGGIPGIERDLYFSPQTVAKCIVERHPDCPLYAQAKRAVVGKGG